MTTFYGFPPHHASQQGFSLMELIFALLIGGIVLSTAVVSGRQAVDETRRAEVIANLLSLSLAQQRWARRTGRYASIRELCECTDAGYFDTDTYRIDLAELSATGFRWQADRTRPGRCARLSIDHHGVKTPAGCWR